MQAGRDFDPVVGPCVPQSVEKLHLGRQRSCGVGVTREAEDEYTEHCAAMDTLSAPLRDCFSYYNGDGKARPGSLAYYGGGQRWHERRMAAQESMEPYVFDYEGEPVTAAAE